jgi:hypothetical protein
MSSLEKVAVSANLGEATAPVLGFDPACKAKEPSLPIERSNFNSAVGVTVTELVLVDRSQDSLKDDPFKGLTGKLKKRAKKKAAERGKKAAAKIAEALAAATALVGAGGTDTSNTVSSERHGEEQGREKEEKGDGNGGGSMTEVARSLENTFLRQIKRSWAALAKEDAVPLLATPLEFLVELLPLVVQTNRVLSTLVTLPGDVQKELTILKGGRILATAAQAALSSTDNELNRSGLVKLLGAFGYLLEAQWKVQNPWGPCAGFVAQDDDVFEEDTSVTAVAAAQGSVPLLDVIDANGALFSTIDGPAGDFGCYKPLIVAFQHARVVTFKHLVMKGADLFSLDGTVSAGVRLVTECSVRKDDPEAREVGRDLIGWLLQEKPGVLDAMRLVNLESEYAFDFLDECISGSDLELTKMAIAAGAKFRYCAETVTIFGKERLLGPTAATMLHFAFPDLVRYLVVECGILKNFDSVYTGEATQGRMASALAAFACACYPRNPAVKPEQLRKMDFVRAPFHPGNKELLPLILCEGLNLVWNKGNYNAVLYNLFMWMDTPLLLEGDACDLLTTLHHAGMDLRFVHKEAAKDATSGYPQLVFSGIDYGYQKLVDLSISLIGCSVEARKLNDEKTGHVIRPLTYALGGKQKDIALQLIREHKAALIYDDGPACYEPVMAAIEFLPRRGCGRGY